MKCFTKLSVCLVFVTVTAHGVKAALLDECVDDAACRVPTGDPNAVCAKEGDTGGDVGGNCICTGAYKNNANSDGCVAKVLGDACGVNSDCAATDNSVCSTEKKCACEANYIEESAACKIATVTDIKCDKGDDDCTVEHSECDDAETSPKCKCSDGYEEDSNDGSTCVKILGGACVGNIDCTGSVDNSVCSEKTCECKANFIEESAVCKKALEQACTDQDTCVSNAECDKECKCLSGFTNSNGFCAAESSATSAWMATSLLVTSILIYLPIFILW